MPLPPFSQTRATGRAMPLSALPRSAPEINPLVTGPSPPKRARKDRGPNWSPQEIVVLIAARREQYLRELDTVDGRDLMTPDTSKWIHISHFVNTAGFSPIPRDGPACKTKWNQLVPDYKRIADYLSRTGRNVVDYWDLSCAERKAEGLPRVFAHDVYEAIHEWYGNRPMIQPPHVRDTLAPSDSNYRPTLSQAHQEYEGGSEPDTEDLSDFPPPDPVHVTEDTTPPRSPRVPLSTHSRSTGPSEHVGTPQSRPYTGLPPGITPHYISSSETSHFAMQRRPGNTGVKRKSVSGHAVIAEATKATGAVMAQQMQDIVDASRDLERSKIGVQLKLFSEQMSYQREKDRRLYENAAIANDNAKLSILKQGEMVSCLSHLSTVLSNSLSMNRNFAYPSMPQTAPQEHNTSDPTFYAAVSHNAPAHTAKQMPPVGTVTANHGSLGGNEDLNYSGDDLPNNLDMETSAINATFPPDVIVNDGAPTNYTAAHDH